MIDNSETLKQQVLISHFTNATGCSGEQAIQLLQDARWQFEIALSTFFQEAAIAPHTKTGINPQCAPSNTPATPPSFTDALLAFHKLHASSYGDQQQQQQHQSQQQQSQQHDWAMPAPKVPLQPVNPYDRSNTSVIRASYPSSTATTTAIVDDGVQKYDDHHMENASYFATNHQNHQLNQDHHHNQQQQQFVWENHNAQYQHQQYNNMAQQQPQ